MTSARLRDIVFLMTIVTTLSVPQDFTTSRYNEESLHDTHYINPINYSQVPQIPNKETTEFPLKYKINLSENIRSSKAPKNDEFFSVELSKVTEINNLTQESRKFKNKGSELYSNFIRNKVEDSKDSKKNVKNKFSDGSLKKNGIIPNNNTKIYTNFIKNTFRDTHTLKPINSNISIIKMSSSGKLTGNVNVSNLSQKFVSKNVTSNLKHGVHKLNSKNPNNFQIKVQRVTTIPPKRPMIISIKPIVLKMTKVPITSKKSPTKKTQRITSTHGWISKIKSTTIPPPTPTKKTSTYSFGWPNNNIQNKKDFNRYKNYTDMNLSSMGFSKNNSNIRTTTSKPKPNKLKYIVKPGQKPTLQEIKQNWYEAGVPYPNPMPEISSNSPPFSLADVSSLPTPLETSEDDSESIQVDAAEQNPISNVVSNFNLLMDPSNTKDASGVDDTGCPTIHISSSVLNPQQREGCSDLNLVINSHFHQNTVSDRTPSIDTYDANNQEDTVDIEAVEEEVPQADIGSPQSDIGAPLADGGFTQSDGGVPGGSSGGTGGNGASGGSGGNGGDGDGGGLQWPDLKNILYTIDWVGEKLHPLFDLLRNPYLYIIPAVIFFLMGFILIIALFPWWVPLLFLYVGVKSKQKPHILYHNHVQKVVHHPDGWFWNHQTKSWENVQDYLHKKRIDQVNLSHIPQAIDHFGKKYGYDTVTRRKKNRSLQYGDINERTANQVMEVRKDSEPLVLDTRTPPKIKLHGKRKINYRLMKNIHMPESPYQSMKIR
ncbi:hypothetical protein HHI36_011391 [Cryptolaemus montrouzieri]|uniref:Uncharacterized protein n=1 Tax=Cryptolaemus montrouzieri TaxID=559131 RepID=A0ABD2MLJ3_9CUCU